MEIAGIVVPRKIADKIQSQHQVTPDEVGEVFANQPRFYFAESGHVAGEDLYRALGQTDAGRYLVVFFVYKRTRQALVITAREMERKERRQYAKK